MIVTLTTFGQRLNDVYLAIESIMQGSLLPNRIILWLADDMRGKVLPVTLQNKWLVVWKSNILPTSVLTKTVTDACQIP